MDCLSKPFRYPNASNKNSNLTSRSSDLGYTKLTSSGGTQFSYPNNDGQGQYINIFFDECILYKGPFNFKCLKGLTWPNQIKSILGEHVCSGKQSR